MLTQKIKLKPEKKKQILHKEVQSLVKESKVSEKSLKYLEYELNDLTLSKTQKSFEKLTEDAFELNTTPTGKTSIWNLMVNGAPFLNVLSESLKSQQNEEEHKYISAKIAALVLRCKRVKFKLFVIDRLLFLDSSLLLKALKRHYEDVCQEMKSTLVHIDLTTAPKNEVLSNFDSATTFYLITKKLITFESYLKDMIVGLCEGIRIPINWHTQSLPDSVTNSLISLAPYNLKGKLPDYYIILRFLLKPPSNLNSEQLNQWNSYYKEFCHVSSFWSFYHNVLDFESYFPRDFHIEQSYEEIIQMPVISKTLFSKIISTFTKLSPYFWFASLTFYHRHLKNNNKLS